MKAQKECPFPVQKGSSQHLSRKKAAYLHRTLPEALTIDQDSTDANWLTLFPAIQPAASRTPFT
jgi:hypothetical protein